MLNKGHKKVNLKTKRQQLEDLHKTKMWSDFNSIEPISELLFIANEDDDQPLVYWNEKTLLMEMEWIQDSINSNDLYWIEDMLLQNPKEVYKLRSKVKYYINKWKKITNNRKEEK